ncbi:MAG TPA: LysR family transcriptional regulator [Ktedonosporobacter sp.]|nr:LysR family transcriptional regulator [Ktedonosporobacter sp.]
MEFRQLTYFLTAAQTQNFRQAAELCLVAQPALSRQIAALEAELGVELFKRSRQRVTLTAAGQEFATYVSNAFEQLQLGQQAMAKIQEGEGGTVVVGSVEPLTHAFLPEIFAAFHQQYPQVRLTVRVSRTDELMTLVEQGEVDLGLLFNPTIHSELVVMQELFRQPLQLLVAQHHPLAQVSVSSLTLARIMAEPLYLLGPTSRLRKIIDRVCMQRAIVVQPLVEIDAIEGLKALVRQGNGVTLMLPALLRPDQVGGDLILLPIADMTEEFIFALVYRRFGSLSKQARQFMNTITGTPGQSISPTN